MKSKHLTSQLKLDFYSDAAMAPEPNSDTSQRDVAFAPHAAEPVRRTACVLRAGNDAEAIEVWLAAKCSDAGRDRLGRPAHTTIAYAREARRFLLWLQVERKTSLIGAALEDCVAYKSFLADPQPRERWCAPRGAKVGAAEWRPFAGPLSARSCRQAITILSGLFSFLQDQQYRLGNPWAGISMPRNSKPMIDTGRSLSRSQWMAVEREIQEGPSDFRWRQLGWAIRFAYVTGLRLSELVCADCGDLRWVEIEDSKDDWPETQGSAVRAAWLIRVCGKGLKIRDVPVPSDVIDEFGEILTAAGASNDPRRHRDRPLLVTLKSVGTGALGASCERLSSQTLYRQLKMLFCRVAARMTREGRHADADVFAQVSTHWLRHTHCVHAIARGTPVDVVQQNAGHTSLSTTTLYCRSGLARRVRESNRLNARHER
jgi:site-specific recombinase XerD